MSERGKSIMADLQKQGVRYMFYPDQLAPSPHFGAAGASGISLHQFPEIKQIRDCGQGIDVTRRDSGDRFFTWLGVIVPILSIIIVVVYLYKIELSDLSFF